ncbi:hypothetical protein ACU6XI_09720 [Klebsiella aerogenes]|uniref:hypothetical protein n=1 Tax=Klebsiella aerogenes TaxID=548 RepID=UPI002293E4DE|nr:hypothetical protein [Klebsiella aerogenes]HCT7429043.1 hypothetical protein [Klebsiella aerogenes]
MSKDNSGPAFPYSGIHKGEKENMIVDSHGMTLRDYFAAKAMQAMISNQSIIDSDSDGAVNFAASASYKFSDAMLKAREVE